MFAHQPKGAFGSPGAGVIVRHKSPNVSSRVEAKYSVRATSVLTSQDISPILRAKFLKKDYEIEPTFPGNELLHKKKCIFQQLSKVMLQRGRYNKAQRWTLLAEFPSGGPQTTPLSRRSLSLMLRPHQSEEWTAVQMQGEACPKDMKKLPTQPHDRPHPSCSHIALWLENAKMDKAMNSKHSMCLVWLSFGVYFMLHLELLGWQWRSFWRPSM